MTRRNFFLCIASPVLMASSSLAFSARSVQKPFASSQTALKSSMASLSEQEAFYRMAKARECAFSDTCSIEESKEHLNDVLHIQEACASGAVAGHDLCDDQQEAAEVVALLRQHVLSGQHGLTTRQQAMVSGGVLPLVFLFLTCASMWLVNLNPNVAPFTAQEVMWAARDGYLDDLVHHFVQNGGLLISDNPVTPFTFQEVVWAARDGYLDDLVHHFMQNGGL